MEDFARYRSEFEICKQFVFLDHAAQSPTHQRMVTRVNEYLSDSTFYNHYEMRWLDYAESVRNYAARLVRTTPKSIAFVNNVTMGACIVANGVKIIKGDNIVVPANQFPANVYPWLNLQGRGIEVRLVKLPRNESCYDILFKSVDTKTRLIAISLVEYDDGFRHNLKLVSDFCRNQNILLFVDAVQGLGALQFSVQKVPVDFLAVSGHKWLLGPTGQGFLYIRPEHLSSIYILLRGWLSVENPWDFHNYSQSFKSSTTQIEGGTANLMGISALGAGLEMILEADPKKIEAQVLSLTSFLAKRLSDKGYRLTTNLQERYRSGILSFQHPRISSKEISQSLSSHNVQVSERNDKIRVSPHFYNTVDDINALIDALPN